MNRMAVMLWCFVLSGCISPEPDYSGKALLRSAHPLVKLDQEILPGLYELYVAPGEYTVQAVYETASHDYVCTFKWRAEAQTRYEIAAHEKQYPLSLYRWKRRNSLWAVRLDAVSPISCGH